MNTGVTSFGAAVPRHPCTGCSHFVSPAQVGRGGVPGVAMRLLGALQCTLTPAGWGRTAAAMPLSQSKQICLVHIQLTSSASSAATAYAHLFFNEMRPCSRVADLWGSSAALPLCSTQPQSMVGRRTGVLESPPLKDCASACPLPHVDLMCSPHAPAPGTGLLGAHHHVLVVPLLCLGNGQHALPSPG